MFCLFCFLFIVFFICLCDYFGFLSCCFFFFKQKTAYEMRISDWSSTCALPILGDTAVLRHYLAPILPLLEPVEVTELVINKPGEIGIEDHLGWHWHNVDRKSVV